MSVEKISHYSQIIANTFTVVFLVAGFIYAKNEFKEIRENALWEKQTNNLFNVYNNNRLIRYSILNKDSTYLDVYIKRQKEQIDISSLDFYFEKKDTFDTKGYLKCLDSIRFYKNDHFDHLIKYEKDLEGKIVRIINN